MPRDGYALPEDLDRHAPNRRFAPEGLREACRSAGEGLGAEDARLARFRPAAEIVGMWRGLDLPAWASPYVLRDARARWGERWKQKLEAALRRASDAN